MIVPSAEQIRQRLRRARTCDNSHRHPSNATCKDWFVDCDNPAENWCNSCAIQAVAILLDTLSQELERLKEENQMLLTRRDRSGSAKRLSAAPTNGKG